MTLLSIWNHVVKWINWFFLIDWKKSGKLWKHQINNLIFRNFHWKRTFWYFSKVFQFLNFKTLKIHSPGENKMTAFMHPTSLESGDNCLNLHKISWTVFISTQVAGSSGILSRTCGLSKSVAKSQGTLHCAKLSRKSSFHDSCSNNCWSVFESVWNGTRHRTHRTAMKRSLAVVSCNEENSSHNTDLEPPQD